MDRELLGARAAHAARRVARRVTADQRRRTPGGQTITRPTVCARPTLDIVGGPPGRSSHTTAASRGECDRGAGAGRPRRTGSSDRRPRYALHPEGCRAATTRRSAPLQSVDCGAPRQSGTAAQNEPASRSSTHEAPSDHSRQMGIGRHHAVGAERSPKRPSNTRVTGLRPDDSTSEEVDRRPPSHGHPKIAGPTVASSHTRSATTASHRTHRGVQRTVCPSDAPPEDERICSRCRRGVETTRLHPTDHRPSSRSPARPLGSRPPLGRFATHETKPK